ncbi:MAG: LamG domain-containing protein [bacterium]|nr:LamG domain-containing protein [bacterium]
MAVKEYAYIGIAIILSFLGMYGVTILDDRVIVEFPSETCEYGNLSLIVHEDYTKLKCGRYVVAEWKDYVDYYRTYGEPDMWVNDFRKKTKITLKVLDYSPTHFIVRKTVPYYKGRTSTDGTLIVDYKFTKDNIKWSYNFTHKNTAKHRIRLKMLRFEDKYGYQFNAADKSWYEWDEEVNEHYYGDVKGNLFVDPVIEVPDSDWVIDGNTVYVNNSKARISATPHTIYHNQDVIFTLDIKNYTGNVDLIWGFDREGALPTGAFKEVEKNKTWNTSTTREFLNVTEITASSDPCEIGNEYNSIHRWAKWCRPGNVSNGSGPVCQNATICFDSYENTDDDYNVTWHTTHFRKWKEWKDISGAFDKKIFQYEDMDEWYLKKDFAVTAGTTYSIKANIKITGKEGKYWFCGKPSSMTIQQAIDTGNFLCLDPWWNSTYDRKRDLNCTGMTDGVPFMINFTGGFNLGCGPQSVWTACQGTGMAVYYMDADCTDWVIANDDGLVPWDTEIGNNSGYLVSTLWSDYTGEGGVWHLEDTNDALDVRNGTATGAYQDPGFFGNAYYFDGVNDRIVVADEPDPSSNITIFAWVRSDGQGSGSPYNRNIAIWNDATNQMLIYTRAGSSYDEWRGRAANTGANDPAIAEDAEANDASSQWRFLYSSYVSGTNSLYVYNASSGSSYQLIDSDTGDSGADWTGNLYFGCQADLTREWKGWIDEVRIAPKQFSISYVQQIYNNSIGLSGYGDLGAEEVIGIDYYRIINCSNCVNGNTYRINGSSFYSGNDLTAIDFLYDSGVSEYKIDYDDTTDIVVKADGVATDFNVLRGNSVSSGPTSVYPTTSQAVWPFIDYGSRDFDITGTAGADGKLKGAYYFGGSNDIVQTGEGFYDGNGDFTISAWINHTDSGVLVVFDKDGGTNNNRFSLTVNQESDGTATDGWISMTTRVGSTLRRAPTANPNIDDGAWHHVVFIYDDTADTGDWWIDGVNVADSGSVAGGDIHQDGQGYKFGEGYSGSNDWEGKLDDFRFYNKTLNATEIGKLYVTGTGTEAETITPDYLAAHFTFNSLSDQTSNSFDLTAEAGVTYDASEKNNTGAVYFDGSNYIDVPDVSNLTGDTTGAISFWFKTSDNVRVDISTFSEGANNDAGNLFIACCGSCTTTYGDESMWLYIRSADSNKVSGFVRDGTGHYCDGEWHHAFYYVNSTANGIYMDGVKKTLSYKDGSAATTGWWTNPVTLDTLTLGALYWAGSYTSHYDGYMSGWTYRNDDINPTLIAPALYNNGRPDGVQPGYADLGAEQAYSGDAPTISKVEWYPANPQTATNLNANVTASESPTNITCNVKKDGVSMWNQSTAGTNPVVNVSSGNTAKGEVWTAACVATNAIGASAEVSNTTTILNTVPTQDNPKINTTTGTNYTWDNPRCNGVNVVDPDGDSIIEIFNWQKDGVTFAYLNMPFEANGFPTTNTSTWTRDYAGQMHGTVGGATWGNDTGYYGDGAYSFNNSNADNFINISGNDNMSVSKMAAWTFNAFINCTETSDSDGRIVYTDSDGSEGIEIICGDPDGDDGWGVNLIGGSPGEVRSDNFTSGEYFMASVVYDGTTMYLYKDNVLQTEQAIAELNASPAATNVYLGYEDGGTEYTVFNGTLDYPMIFPRDMREELGELFAGYYWILDNAFTSVGENWTCCLTPNDQDPDGETKCGWMEIVGGVPINTVASIVPVNATVLDKLNGTCSYDAPENGTLDIYWCNGPCNVTTTYVGTWWNDSYQYKINFSWVEDQNLSRDEEYVKKNFTGLTNLDNCSTLRIVDSTETTEIPRQTFTYGSDWCEISILQDETALGGSEFWMYYGGGTEPTFTDIVLVNESAANPIIRTLHTTNRGYKVQLQNTTGVVIRIYLENQSDNIVYTTNDDIGGTTATGQNLFFTGATGVTCSFTYDGIYESKYTCINSDYSNAKNEWYFRPHNMDMAVTLYDYTPATWANMFSLSITAAHIGTTFYHNTSKAENADINVVDIVNGYLTFSAAGVGTSGMMILWDEDRYLTTGCTKHVGLTGVGTTANFYYMMANYNGATQCPLNSSQYYNELRWEYITEPSGDYNQQGYDWEKRYDNPLSDSITMGTEIQNTGWNVSGYTSSTQYNYSGAPSQTTDFDLGSGNTSFNETWMYLCVWNGTSGRVFTNATRIITGGPPTVLNISSSYTAFIGVPWSHQFNCTLNGAPSVQYNTNSSMFDLNITSGYANLSMPTIPMIGTYSTKFWCNNSFGNSTIYNFDFIVDYANATYCNLYLNGVQGLRNYEYGSVGNITTTSDGSVCIDIGWINSEQCWHPPGTNSFNYTFNTLKVWKFNDSTTSKTAVAPAGVSFILDNRTILANGTVNISGNVADYPENFTLTMRKSDNSTWDFAQFQGILQGTNIYNNYFIYGDANATAQNISYTRANSKTYYVKFSTNNADYHNATNNSFSYKVSLTGIESNDGINSVTNDTYNNAPASYTKTNLVLPSPLDSFENNETELRQWDFGESDGGSGTKTHYVYIDENGASDGFLYMYSQTGNGVYSSSWAKTTAENDASIASLNLGYFTNISFRATKSTTGDGTCTATLGEHRTYLSDGVTDILITTDVGYMTLYKNGTNMEIWDGAAHRTPVSVATLDSGSEWSIIFENYARAGGPTIPFDSCSATKVTTKVYYLNTSQPRMVEENNNPMFYNTSVTGNLTSPIQKEYAFNVTSATVTWEDQEAIGTEILYWVSTNNGSDWVSASVNGGEYFFADAGNITRWKMSYTTSDNEYTPLNKWLRFQVVGQYPDTIAVDFGADGSYEYRGNSTLNSTYAFSYARADVTSELTDPFEILADYEDSTLVYDFPIRLTTSSAGDVGITLSNLTYNVNPVNILNVTDLETMNGTQTMNSDDGNITYSQLSVIFHGNLFPLPISCDPAHSTSTADATWNASIWFSNFTLAYPQGMDSIMFLPYSPTQQNLQPYGQTATTPVLNITGLAYGGQGFNFSMYLNSTISCINITASATNSKAAGSILSYNTWAGNTVFNLTDTESGGVWLWADLDCSYGAFYTPGYIFRGCCLNCSDCGSGIT